MKQENFLFSKCDGQFFTWYSCTSEKNSYDIVKCNRTGDLTYLTNGIEGEMCNMHSVICRQLKLRNITVTILVDGIVKEFKTMNDTIKGAINKAYKGQAFTILGARLIN